MRYGRFLSDLVAVYFGVFVFFGMAAGNERHGQGRNQHQPQGHQRQPQFNRGQQQQGPQFNRSGPQFNQRRPEFNRSRQQPQQNERLRQQSPTTPQVRQDRQHRNDRQERRGRDVYRDWRGHRDFRPAHVNHRYYQYRHQHFVHYFTHERYRTWRHRHHVFYGVYLPRTYVVYYDGINPYWIFWLRDNPRYFALWVYNHRFEISAERYEALLLENEELREQIRELEERNAPVDYNYTPPEVDEDMPYSEEYIEKYRQQ